MLHFQTKVDGIQMENELLSFLLISFWMYIKIYLIPKTIKGDCKHGFTFANLAYQSFFLMLHQVILTLIGQPLISTKDMEKMLSFILAMAIEPTILFYIGIVDKERCISQLRGAIESMSMENFFLFYYMLFRLCLSHDVLCAAMHSYTTFVM